VSSPIVETSGHGETNLHEKSCATTAGESIAQTRDTVGIATRRVGVSTVGEVIKPGVDIGIHDAGTEGGGEAWDRG